MTWEEAESLLDEYIDKHKTMMDYVEREDYIVWTKEAEYNARSEYMQLKNKLIELICGQDSILDKIRAEIEEHCGLVKDNHCRYCSYCNSVMGVREILEIIDKYRTESEDEEWNDR